MRGGRAGPTRARDVSDREVGPREQAVFVGDPADLVPHLLIARVVAVGRRMHFAQTRKRLPRRRRPEVGSMPGQLCLGFGHLIFGVANDLLGALRQEVSVP